MGKEMMKLKEMGGGGGGDRSCGGGVWGVDLGGGGGILKELKKMLVIRVEVEEGGVMKLEDVMKLVEVVVVGGAPAIGHRSGGVADGDGGKCW